ncbi:cytochrome P450 CYP736A12-like [Lotus japonicus]|uniref:cytochrome P450 CYP736A12-like n=1 Tax=Lotus japonicus TaxID=34305 RepID=UPI00258AFEEF|nr:cytochrome P450 CYP736A12-like [Lotus japonicus]
MLLMLPSIPLLLLFTFTTLILSATLFRRRKHGRRRPPGPRGLPVIGNLHRLGKLPHRTLQALAKLYGPIMSLQLGQVPTVIVSSSEAAEQFLKTHDLVFSSRHRIQATQYIAYGSKGLVFSEYGPYWRNMRKLCTLQLLTSSKVESFAPLRMREVQVAVKSLEKAATASEVVDLSEVVNNLLEDIVYKMVLGCSKDDEFDLKGLIQRGMNLSGTFNLADYVPCLGVLDLQGLKRSFKETSKGIDQVLEKIIQEHESGSNVQNGGHHKDFTDILLSHMNQPIDSNDEHSHVIDRTHIKAIILDMIAGAFETAATVVEWALSELLRHPRVMKNLQDELDNVVGLNKLVEEDDLAKLNYLDAVINEALRLYPPGPLVPRESIEDAMVHGYFIEKKSRIILNLWAIGRDSKIWSDNAEEFYPERFTNNSSDFRGHDFKFIPFGYGRRGCPGMNLGIVTVKLVVAQLVHCFSWKLPPHTSPIDLDMSEKFGLTIPRVKHLFGVPTYRLMRETLDRSS